MSKRVYVPKSPPASSPGIAAVMRGNKKRDTKPELIVRRMLFAKGYRFRTHGIRVPGNPDIVFAARRKALFVHGCFWHQHKDSSCPYANRKTPSSSYWRAKLARNVQRDREVQSALAQMGWRVCIVWECEAKRHDQLVSRLQEFLGPRVWNSSNKVSAAK
ncbi:very short patch repair endonuclease [Hyphomicrobium sp. CS1GBMeth3]|uniref:very short patch repair endonuclease n=1 Tax=Hyphomicrobium sp. CS1GBMeth3 TaxID=1892845 RepID=UPI0009F833BF|nr:very short patch repair endonuclease [Hyphomicrobium sp. CS1GBMeth3]